MELIDTHCHLAHGRLRQDVPAALARARQAGVTNIICAASDLVEAKTCLGLTREHEGLHFTAGVHPHEAKNAGEGYLDELQRLAAEPRCVAVGEIGLDYHYDFSPRDVQRRVFSEQIALAGRVGKTIVIHTREAFEDTMAIIASAGADGGRIVFHSFTEGPDMGRRVLDIGAAISFSGIVTFKNSDELRRTAALVPDDRLLIETDAPYLSPEPVRKMKTNEPANVAHVAAALAAARGTTVEAIAEITTRNAKRVFALR